MSYLYPMMIGIKEKRDVIGKSSVQGADPAPAKLNTLGKNKIFEKRTIQTCGVAGN